MAVKFTRDAGLNDSSKSFQVPVGRTWKIQFLSVDLVSTATVGNRQITLDVYDGSVASGNLVYSINAGAVQAASATVRYEFYPQAPNETSVVNGGLKTHLPDIILSSQWSINVSDSAAVDAAADDMTVNFIYNERVAD